MAFFLGHRHLCQWRKRGYIIGIGDLSVYANSTADKMKVRNGGKIRKIIWKTSVKGWHMCASGVK